VRVETGRTRPDEHRSPRAQDGFAAALDGARALQRARARRRGASAAQQPHDPTDARAPLLDAEGTLRRRAAASPLAAPRRQDGRLEELASQDGVRVGPPVDGQPREVPGDLSASPLVPPSAIERLVVAVIRQAQGTALQLQLGESVSVRVEREPSGVAVLLSASSVPPARAQSELAGIVRALRARGVAVARARSVGSPSPAAHARAPRGAGSGWAGVVR
jgi:hypothetical protein